MGSSNIMNKDIIDIAKMILRYLRGVYKSSRCFIKLTSRTHVLHCTAKNIRKHKMASVGYC